MGKRSKDRVGKKERRRAEAAALARSTWLTETAGLSTATAPGVAPGADARPNKAARAAVRPISTPGSGAQPDKTPTPDAPPASTAGAPPTAADAPPTAVDATELAARLASLSTNLQRELGRADAGDGLTRARLSRSQDAKTVMAGINAIKGQYNVAWASQAAMSAIASIPTIVVFIVFQRYFIAGLTLGAVKE